MALRISVIGDAFVDVVVAGLEALPTWGKDVCTDSLAMVTGSSSGNTSASLAAMGVETHYFTLVGNDKFGKMFTATMKEFGVHTEGIAFIADKPTAVCIVLSGAAQGDRCFINSLGSNNVVSGAHFWAQKDTIARSPHVHVGGYYNCANMQSRELVELLRWLRSKGKTISLDTQTDFAGDWLGVGKSLLEVLPLVDVFLPSETEAKAIARADTVADAVAKLAKLMHKDALLVVKLGEHGALVARNGSVLCEHAAFKVKVVDPTGAGDAFNAAFLTKWLSGPKLEEAMLWGCAAGSLRCVSIVTDSCCCAGAIRVGLLSGAENAPSTAELQRFIDSHPRPKCVVHARDVLRSKL